MYIRKRARRACMPSAYLNTPNSMARIYTKTGDKGETSILGGTRLPKSHLRIEAYGNVDELNAYIGLLRDLPEHHTRFDILLDIQHKLFVIGSLLAADPERNKMELPQLEEEAITTLEKLIDDINERTPPMRYFILPGGHISISHTHVARCICRRAERAVVALHQQQAVDERIIRFLNRLSDYLFALCRLLHVELNIEETPWKPSKP